MRRLSMLALACAGSLAGCPDEEDDGPPSAPAWRVVFDDDALDRALMAVWGTSSTSVYVVGGPLGNDGFDALAMHFDGSSWRDLDVGGADSFWWVHGTSDDDVWMVGENGRISHFDGAAIEEHDSGTTATLWGAMAFAADDVWAVGGMVGGPDTQPDDVVLHFDGSSWQSVALPGEAKNRALFKVWGTSSNDLFVVGEAGVIWHKTGADWVEGNDPPIAGGSLTTVHGCSSSDVYAVGGRDLLHYDGEAWSKLDQALSNDLNGVSCVDASNAAIVGMGGLKQRLVDGVWQDDFTKDPHGSLHAVWADETGAYWVVGGDFLSSPKPGVARNGIVARFGPGAAPSTLE